MMNKKVLTIAGSDSSGGAGIQADIKTMCAYGIYGMSVITAVTAQNTLGVQQVEDVPAGGVEAQLASVLSDLRPDGVKIGMVYSVETVQVIAEAIDRWNLTKVVLDPVMVSTSGRMLMKLETAWAMQELLFPRALLVTPNLPEAERLAEMLGEGGIREEAGDRHLWVEAAGRRFARRWNTAFLLKGGHLEGEPADYLYDGAAGMWFPGKRVETRHTHGTGCTLSSAIACNLALGSSLKKAVGEAKGYLEGCIRHHPGFGAGNGPLNHLWRMEECK